MTNTFKVLAACLLSILATTTACQDDYDLPVSGQVSGSTTHRILTGSEAVKKKDMLITHLKADGEAGLQKLRQTFSRSATSRYTWRELESLVDYSEVYEIQNDLEGEKKYTFRIAHPDATETKFYNIVIKDYLGARKTVLIAYE